MKEEADEVESTDKGKKNIIKVPLLCTVLLYGMLFTNAYFLSKVKVNVVNVVSLDKHRKERC